MSLLCQFECKVTQGPARNAHHTFDALDHALANLLFESSSRIKEEQKENGLDSGKERRLGPVVKLL